MISVVVLTVSKTLIKDPRPLSVTHQLTVSEKEYEKDSLGLRLVSLYVQ